MIAQAEQQTDTSQELFVRLYLEAFPTVADFVANKGGSLEQAKDIFQDALVIYYESVITKGAEIRVSEKAYLVGISRHLWYKSFRLDQDYEPLSDAHDRLTDDKSTGEPSAHKLLNFLEKTGQKCMDLLKAFYYDQLSLSKISEQFGFSGTRSATVQKFKCMEKVRNAIRAKKLSYEDFTD